MKSLIAKKASEGEYSVNEARIFIGRYMSLVFNINYKL